MRPPYQQVEHIVFRVARENDSTDKGFRPVRIIDNVLFTQGTRHDLLHYRHHPSAHTWMLTTHPIRSTERYIITTFPRYRRISFVTEPITVTNVAHMLNDYGVVLSSYKPSHDFQGVWIPHGIGLSLVQGHSRVALSTKKKRISVICSGKQLTDYHKQRILFVKSLQEALGDDIDVFGRESHDIPRKSKGIVPYRYHVVLENCCHPHYWTEKIADAYMGEAYPFYAGCPNLHEYFPKESYTPIDIFNIQKSVETVVALSASDLWLEKRDAVYMAKKRYLFQHRRNVKLAHVVNQLAYTLPKTPDAPCPPSAIQ
ncbi:MAG: hypothetical protein GDA54_05770 [Alphaproteobacteria bacterium GM7ARS4]|nr:hypothetical protein [Alphaproteobacteria bacterium GM7ARS4]